MMLVTKVLKKTAGEDNEKTEMYAFYIYLHISPVHINPKPGS
jgi:hypothetical protein